MRLAVVLALASAACGRLGFDTPGSDPTGDGSMGSGMGDAPSTNLDGNGSASGITVLGTFSATGSGPIVVPVQITLQPGDTIIIATLRSTSDTSQVQFAGMNLSEDVSVPSYGAAPLYNSLWSYRASGMTTGNASAIGSVDTNAVMYVVTVRGLAPNPLDRSLAAFGSGTFTTVGPTTTTAAASELVVTVASTDATTCNGTWSAGLTEKGPVGGTNMCMSLGYEILTMTAAPSAMYGMFSSRSWGAGIATYKGQ